MHLTQRSQPNDILYHLGCPARIVVRSSLGPLESVTINRKLIHALVREAQTCFALSGARFCLLTRLAFALSDTRHAFSFAPSSRERWAVGSPEVRQEMVAPRCQGAFQKDAVFVLERRIAVRALRVANSEFSVYYLCIMSSYLPK
jgi:hypothetical protein